MKYRAWSTSVACLAAALLAAPPASARHHKHKAKRAAPAAVGSGATQPDEGATAPAPDPDAGGESAPEPKSPPVKPQPPRAEPARGGSSRAAATDDDPPAAARKLVPHPPAETEAPTTALGVSGSGDDIELGRREAARLATGRTEVAVSIGIDVGRRQFTYSDPIGETPRPYLLAAAPLATFGLEIYPLASTLIPVLCDIGFRGRVSRAFALASSTTNGAPLDNSWTRFTGEVRGRVLAGRTRELGVAAGIDASYFELGTDAGVDVGALVPSARTLSFRLGADGRVRVAGRVSLLAGGAWLAPITRGEIYDRFRRPRVAGIDTELGVAIALTPGAEVRLGGRYTRYFASFDPEVGDAAVAGGALDQQTQMGVALRYAH
jgi:hypothetical protein